MSFRNLLRKVFCKSQEIVPGKSIAGCGHKFIKQKEVTALGGTITTEVPVDGNGSTPYCHSCLEKMVAPCAWCFEPIFIGSPVTLYMIKEEEFKNKYGFSGQEMEQYKKDGELPDGSIIYATTNGYLQLVGCGRTTCADTGADYCGIWMPPGKIERFTSLLEVAVQSKTGSAAASDLTDPETFKAI
ncbi:MAG: hypothetical protein FJZ04_03725 [Candidatus Moranbacteria bacterium]|nr:hypothetical protein [Candidatus Moranbacteria bacterium]